MQMQVAVNIIGGMLDFVAGEHDDKVQHAGALSSCICRGDLCLTHPSADGQVQFTSAAKRGAQAMLLVTRSQVVTVATTQRWCYTT